MVVDQYIDAYFRDRAYLLAPGAALATIVVDTARQYYAQNPIVERACSSIFSSFDNIACYNAGMIERAPGIVLETTLVGLAALLVAGAGVKAYRHFKG